jgi:hypothetical protein
LISAKFTFFLNYFCPKVMQRHGFATIGYDVELVSHDDENMKTIDRLDSHNVMEVAQKMGYDPMKPDEFDRYVDEISKMDLWDISKILFFGRKGDGKDGNAHF